MHYNAPLANFPNLTVFPPYLFNKHSTQIRTHCPADYADVRRYSAYQLNIILVAKP